MPKNKNRLLEQVVTREQFLATYKYDHLASKGVEVLDAHDIFPLNFKNPRFKHINLLGLYLYLSGSITRTDTNGYTTVIAGGRDHQHDLFEMWRDVLGIEFLGEGSNRPGQLSKNGSSYARLLDLMGFHVSGKLEKSAQTKTRLRKGIVGSQLPPYLGQLIEGFDEAGVKAQRATAKYISDMVSVWFDTRFSTSGLYGELDLLAQPNPDLVEKQAEQLRRAIAIRYPNVPRFDDSHVRISRIRKGSGTYQGKLAVPRDILIPLALEKWSPVGLTVQVSPKYSTSHPAASKPKPAKN